MNAKRIAIWGTSYFAFLSLLVFASVRGLPSPRAFGLFGLLSMIGFGLILYLLLKKMGQGSRGIFQSAPLDAATRKKRFRTIWVCRVVALFMVLCLFKGLRQIGHGPLFPILIGVSFNLLMTSGLIYTIVRLQRSLR